MIAGLNEVKGDLSDGQKKFHAALSKLKLKTPLGEISLNENRQATGSVFVTEVSARTPTARCRTRWSLVSTTSPRRSA